METYTVGKQSLLKDLNYRAVIETVAHDGPLSRAAIAERLDLSRPSVSRVIDTLLRSGIVQEGRRVASKAGRPQTLIDINPHAGIVAGLDIRSRKTRLTLASLRGEPLLRMEIATEAPSAEALATSAATALQDLVTRLPTGAGPLLAAAVGISGAWDEEKQRAYAIPNIPALEDVDLATLLRNRFGCRVVVDNDVNYAAIGEMVHGAARHTSDFFYLNLGSGIGGSAIVGGQLQRGAEGFAGELGYLPVLTPDGATPLEMVASRIALTRVARSRGLADDALELFALAEGGNAGATELIGRMADHVAFALVAVIVTLNPALIVLGGSLGRRSDLLIPLLERHIRTALPLCPPIAPTQLREDAPLRGAIATAMEEARALLVERQLAPTA